MANLQCPNCGGYKTFPQFGITEIITTPFFVGLACWMIGVIVLIMKPQILFSIVIPISIVLVFATLIISIIYSRSRQDYYRCKICGYKWDKRNFPDATSIQVNKDLIEKGNILLEQEEAERRRQQQWQEEESRRRQ